MRKCNGGRYIVAAALCLLLFSLITGCASPETGINTWSVVESRVAARYHPVSGDSNRAIDDSGGSGGTQFSSHLPDLIIESITPTQENPSKGDIVTLTVTIKNRGTVRTSTSQVNYYVDGSLKLTKEIEIIQAGDTATEDFIWIAQYGSHTITMIIDEENWIAESNEANNSRSVTITTLIPDLILSSVTWSPENPEEGATVTFSVNVTNIGEGNAVSSFIYPYVNDELIDSVSIQPIAAGETYIATFSYVVQTGYYDIRLTLDPTDIVQETDEDNNVMLFSLPPVLPDLIVEDITWSPSDPSVGETIGFSVTVKNQGGTANGLTRFHYYVGSFSSGFEAIQPIAADSSVTITFTGVAIADEQEVKIILDPTFQVSESDEDNNEYVTVIEGARAADLYIQSLVWSPAEPAIGETLTVSATVNNKGVGTAGSSLISFYIDD
ncbi:MAG: CARDB domain-containing protein, partial [Dehalococcoidales bacterium]